VGSAVHIGTTGTILEKNPIVRAAFFGIFPPGREKGVGKPVK
jgi:aspartyl/asparaginyl beta-hydroxylase (cupin superfamily)